MWKLNLNKIKFLILVIAIMFTFCSKGYEMDYVTGANDFFLSKKEISDLKEKVSTVHDAEAAYKLYEYYEFSEFNEQEAIRWIEISADNGYPLAQYNLALNYLGEISTPNIPIDIERGKKLLEEAAKGGIIEAKELLKELEDKGNAVTP